MQFEIEKGIPEKSRYKNIYPFEQMEVGDSFWVAATIVTRKQLGCNLSNRSRLWAQKHYPERKFSVGQEGGGVRVWRVK